MDAGVTAVIRDTYASSLEMAGSVLEALGETPAAAREAVRRFRVHDEATLAAQYEVKEDESKFLATTRDAAEAAGESCSKADRTDSRSSPWTRRSALREFLVRQAAAVRGRIESPHAQPFWFCRPTFGSSVDCATSGAIRERRFGELLEQAASGALAKLDEDREVRGGA